MKHACRGYTLIELMVVVAVIAILTLMSIPNFLGWLHQYRLQEATVSLMNHLRAARLLAVFTGVKHEVQLKKFGEGNYYQVVEKSPNGDKIVPSIGRIVLDKQFGEVQIKSVSVSSGKVAFKPTGTSTNVTILLENSRGAQVKIIVNTFGRVRSDYL